MEKIKVEKIAWEKGYYVNGLGEAFSKYKQLKSTKDKHYLFFTIKIGKKSRKVHVHRMQAYQKFKDKIYEDNIVVRHLNGNPLDNTFNNIAIGSQSDNMFDIPKDKRVEHAKIASTHIIKYDFKLVEEIRNFYNQCKSYRQTMNKYGIKSKGTLWYILNSRII